jgi:hypothetical protein
MLLCWKALAPFIRIPRDIWATPKMTAIFILREFMKVSSWEDMYQAGSTPIG